MSDNDTATTGIGTTGLLGVAFVVLKLTGVINWHWALVTLPFWAGLAVLAAFSVIALPVVFFTALFKS